MSPQKKNTKASPHSLKSVARRELGIELDKEHQSADWDGELSLAMLEYATMDAQVLLPLAESLGRKVTDAGLEKVSEIEHRALPAIVWMENAGLPLDASGWGEYLGQVEEEMNRLKEQLREIAPTHPGEGEWNFNSSQQLKEIFALEGIELENV